MNCHRNTQCALRMVVSALLLTPCLLAMQTPAEMANGAVDDIWRSIAMVALGGLVTAFVLGRNAVTRQDMTTLETKLMAAMKEQSPWAAVVEHRLEEGEKRLDQMDLRVHKIAEDGQVALGLKEFTLDALKQSRENGERLAKIENQHRRDVA